MVGASRSNRGAMLAIPDVWRIPFLLRIGDRTVRLRGIDAVELTESIQCGAPVIDHTIGDFVDTHSSHHRLILTPVELFGDTVTVIWAVNGRRRHLRHRGQPSTEHKLPVAALVTAATVAHEDQRHRAVMLYRSPQDAWDRT